MTKGIDGKFSLPGPCADCPFRNDRPSFHGLDRVDEIADSLHADRAFSRHKMNDFDLVDGRTTVIECGVAIAMPHFARPHTSYE